MNYIILKIELRWGKIYVLNRKQKQVYLKIKIKNNKVKIANQL